MNRSWINARLFSKAHLDGVSEFMAFVSERFPENAEILCPCRRCLNHIHRNKGVVEDHLYIYGMSSTYDKWLYHGESSHIEITENVVHVDEQIGFSDNAGVDDDHDDEADHDDRIPDLISDLYTAKGQDGGTSMFASILEELKRQLYPGCASFSRFSFVVKLLHIKSFYRISNVAFTALLKLLSTAFPACALPASYDEAKKFIRALGLGYDSIHVCPSNCVLFRKEYAKHNQCPICGASRWRDADGKKKVPQKVLRHFPLIPRLKRIFSSKQTAEEAQWHKLKRKPVKNELSHAADGEAWKDFDRTYGWFAADARNIRLGLATDGFNPYGNMNSSYSMWPVFVMPYNFPPWVCMDQSNFMMTLLIPGPNQCPAKDFDVFLEPLVEELLELWKGVRTFDASSGTMFDLHAAVIWCIHDYPALGVLSGRVTKGYFACVHCDKDPCSVRIRNKICYIGHRRFLPKGHPWRKRKDFNGKVETRDHPGKFTTDELMEQLERVKDVRPGKHPQSKKRKRADGQCWKRRSILFDLPYWASLKVRHNLDVMHIEKNICDYILGTFLGILGKSKDTISARLDLEDMGIRRNLHLQRDGDSYTMPHAYYTMNSSQKHAFCEFIKGVKFPDGYASNLGSCINVDGCNLQRLKTHDCHIILQRLLFAGVRGIMSKDIYEVLAELGIFFQQLCAKTLKLDVLKRMKTEIPLILCKLEKIFPPRFFDICLHLAVHLPDEAILRGPVQYGWMYPIERMLCTLKRFVRNKARPEGSIAEAYVAQECLSYCSRYFDDVETRHNREGRNRERVDLRKGDLSVFQHGVDLLGASRVTYLEHAYHKMVWYVLNNCPEVEPYIQMYRKELLDNGTPDVEKTLEKNFSSWFKEHIAKLRFVDGEDINDELYALSCEPDLRVRLYSACLVGGVRYHTADRERNRRTQNSGIMVEGTHNGEYIDFYGCLREIVELQYNSDFSDRRTVVLFRCDWFDTNAKKGRMKDDGFLRSIHRGRLWYKDDPFILATQATKVFYLEDTKHGGSWSVVQKFTHRHLWSVAENHNDERPSGMGLTYQDDICEEFQVIVNEESLVSEHPDAEEFVNVDASIVDEIRKQRDEGVEEDESSDDEDETVHQYFSDNDGPSFPDVDDSDSE